MRSLKYANEVLQNKRCVPQEVVSVAKRFKEDMDSYFDGDYSNIKNKELVKNLVDYDKFYMTEEYEPCDALVFTTVVMLMYENSLFVVPRKNGKTSVLVHMVRFYHLFYDELTIGIFARDLMLCRIVAKKIKEFFYQEGVMCIEEGEQLRIEGKNNKYILISNSSHTDIGFAVDVLLVDEFLGLPQNSRLDISFCEQIKATTSIYKTYNSNTTLNLKNIISADMFDVCVLYITPKKSFLDVTIEDMVRANPIFEDDKFKGKKDIWFDRYLTNSYERSKYFVKKQAYFMIQHLNMIDL